MSGKATVKALFPLIAKDNSQAHCENFHPITIFESTRCELAIELAAFAMSGKEALRWLSNNHVVILDGLKASIVKYG